MHHYMRSVELMFGLPRSCLQVLCSDLQIERKSSRFYHLQGGQPLRRQGSGGLEGASMVRCEELGCCSCPNSPKTIRGTASEARSLRGRAAEQVSGYPGPAFGSLSALDCVFVCALGAASEVALNEAKIREIRQALTGTAGHFCKSMSP